MSGDIQGNSSLQVIQAVTQFVGGTQAIWNTITVPIPAGLVVYAVDTTVVKMGDGVTLYSNLPSLFTIDQIVSMAASIVTLTNDNTTTAGEITALQTSLAALQATVAALQASSNVTTLTNEVATLTTEYNTLSGEYATINTSLATTIANLATLQTQVNNLNNATLLADITTLTNEYNTLNTEYTTLNNTVSTLQTTVNNLSTTVTPIPGEITTINSEISTINTSLAGKPNFSQIAQIGSNSASVTGPNISTSVSFTAARNCNIVVIGIGGSTTNTVGSLGLLLTATGVLSTISEDEAAPSIAGGLALYTANAGASVHITATIPGSSTGNLTVQIIYIAIPTT